MEKELGIIGKLSIFKGEKAPVPWKWVSNSQGDLVSFDGHLGIPLE